MSLGTRSPLFAADVGRFASRDPDFPERHKYAFTSPLAREKCEGTRFADRVPWPIGRSLTVEVGKPNNALRFDPLEELRMELATLSFDPGEIGITAGVRFDGALTTVLVSEIYAAWSGSLNAASPSPSAQRLRATIRTIEEGVDEDIVGVDVTRLEVSLVRRLIDRIGLTLADVYSVIGAVSDRPSLGGVHRLRRNYEPSTSHSASTLRAPQSKARSSLCCRPQVRPVLFDGTA